MHVNYLVCLACGKYLVVPAQPQNPTKSVELLCHYSLNKRYFALNPITGKMVVKKRKSRYMQ
jgi:hypothetical protein